MESRGGCHRFSHLVDSLVVGDRKYKYYNVPLLNIQLYDKLPYCMRILLESVVRNCDDFEILNSDVDSILQWNDSCDINVPFKPSRIIFQDFTGLPALIDLAAMRDAVVHLGGRAESVDTSCIVDLVIDHSPSIDIVQRCSALPKVPTASSTRHSSSGHLNSAQVSTASNSNRSSAVENGSWPASEDVCPFHKLKTEGSSLLQRNQQLEFERNKERLLFIKWAASAFSTIRVIPPGTGSSGMHQMNVAATLCGVCSPAPGWLCPDTVIGTDSHVPVNNAFGVFSIASGAVETEAAMLGHANRLAIAGVVGCRIVGNLPPFVSSTDIVLAVTKSLRLANVAGKLVEFFGPGVTQLSLSDRLTIANMSPEYGALAAFFAVDNDCLNFLQQAGWHDTAGFDALRSYLDALHLIRDYSNSDQDPNYSQIVDINLASIKCFCSGPRRPQDRVEISRMKSDFLDCLADTSSSRGIGLDRSRQSSDQATFTYDGTEFTVKHGDVMVASVTSCTNSSSPLAMLAAGLVAKKAVNRGLKVRPFVKTSFIPSPGPGIVPYYLCHGDLVSCLQQLRFNISGYGCETCLSSGNELSPALSSTIQKCGLVTVGVMSNTQRQVDTSAERVVLANYIMSPSLVLAYCLAGTVLIDFDTEAIGLDQEGQPVYLHDVWPTRSEVLEVERVSVWPMVFKEINTNIRNCLEQWDKLTSVEGASFPWNNESTYIRSPSFFESLTAEPPAVKAITQACVLLSLGDSVSTDHISIAGSIAKNSPAARYLAAKGVIPREFNSYGSRRGNDAVMVRSMFVNSRLQNRLVAGKPAPLTLHVPSGAIMEVYDAAMKYREAYIPLIILAGKDYGVGSPRDWVAKGQAMLGVVAIVAESFDEAHRCSLVQAGILPLQFVDGQSSSSLQLTGKESYTINLSDDLCANQTVRVELNDGRSFDVKARLSDHVEVGLYRHGGLLHYVARQSLMKS